jgi:hypothetical protein
MSIYGPNGESWFWRAWTNSDSYSFDGVRESSRDFRLKSEARSHAERNGGGTIRKMRFRGSNSTESRMDSIDVPEKRTVPT